MKRKRIETIINQIDNISQKNYDDEFNLAVYIYIRYGLFEFKNYICDNELEEINKILKQNNTIFNEDINEQVSMILNNTEDEESEE